MLPRILLALATVVLGGCAVHQQAVVPLETATVAAKNARIGVAMSTMPTIDTHFPGAGCLLCLAAASMANNSLTSHTKTLPLEDLPNLKQEVAKRIRAKGGNVVVIEEPLDVSKLDGFNTSEPNVARRNYSPLREKLGVDRLVVLEVSHLGFWRTYSSYFPTSDPKATIQGAGYMVDLSNNRYLWYQPLMVMKASDKAWDEPPRFPGLTNAYYQALEMGKDTFLKPFE